MSETDKNDMTTALVMVVDDDSFYRELLAETLKDQGYRALTAASGKEAIETIAASCPDLILLDVIMPGMNGYDVCRALKESPHSQNIPIIFVSGQNESIDKVQGFEVGGVDYVTKPVQLEEFLARVQTHIQFFRLTKGYERALRENRLLVKQRTKELDQANTARQQSESKFRHLFLHSPVSLWDLDLSGPISIIEGAKPNSNEDLCSFLQDHPEISRRCAEHIKILDVNLAALLLFEANNQKVLSEKFSDTFTPTLYQAFNKIIAALLQGNPNLETDASIETLKGNYRDIILRTQKVSSDQNTALYRVLVSALDITDRQRTQDALQESENRYRLVMEASPDPIAVYNMQGETIYINPAFTRVFGWTYEEVVGRKIDYVPESVWAETQAMLNRLNRGDTYFGFETQRYDKNKNILDITISFGVWKNRSGDPAGSVVILRDVTEERKLQIQLQQAQKMESIGTLAGGIAHDFNNILAAILGYAELSTKEDITQATLSRYLKKIQQSGNRARDLVQQILTFSRTTDAGKSPINITPVIKEVLHLLRATIPATIEIHEHLNADQDRINGNPTQIHQILINLFTNANFAMRQNGGILEVRLENTALIFEKTVGHFQLVPGDYLKLTVRDTGHGISPVHIDKIFDPYFTTKSKKEGTGMGLSIVHGIVKDHAGAINVESQLEIGTRFDIYFPLSADEHLAEIETFQPIEKGSGSLLLVDDEESLVDAYGEMIEDLGYQVTGKTESRTALDLFRREPFRFDMVLADYTMPNLTGAQLAAAILKIRPDIPVILYSGYAEDLTTKQIKQLGIKDMIEKPLSKNQLAQVLNHYL